MANIKLFIDLTRLNKPTGYMLLFWPCMWGLTIAYDFNDNLYQYLFYSFLFFSGSVLMRSAGCIINDIVDRNFDKKVERTKNRPIAARKISVLLASIYSIILIMLKSFTIILTFISFVMTGSDRGWQHPQTGWEVVTTEMMSFYLVQSAFLDNVELEEDQNDVIGVFFGDQNIGWEFYNSQLTIIPTTGDNGSMPNYPYEVAPITLKVYDASDDIILEASSLDDIPVWEYHGFETISNIYSCSSDFPLLENGECLLSCTADPNLDGEINALDIIEIVALIIECELPFNCFEDNINCMDVNGDNIIDVLDILSTLNMILRF